MDKLQPKTNAAAYKTLERIEMMLYTYRARKIKQHIVCGICLELKLLRKGFVDGDGAWVRWVVADFGCRNHDTFTDYHSTFADTRSVATPADASVTTPR
eukprot:COSAG02_NODE_5673_length_4139_cov_2.729950_4_plen_99_part_00